MTLVREFLKKGGRQRGVIAYWNREIGFISTSYTMDKLLDSDAILRKRIEEYLSISTNVKFKFTGSSFRSELG